MAVPGKRLEGVQPVHGIDHISIPVRRLGSAKRFYALALRPLGFRIVLDWPDGGRVHLGRPGEQSALWLVENGDPGHVAVAFAAPDGAAVAAFHTAAVAAGARSLSQPAFHPEYTRHTYAAQILDPDGNSLEAICRNADPAAGAFGRAA